MPKSSRGSSSTSSRRLALYRDIISSGRTMPTPCSFCNNGSSRCVVDLRSGRCAECVRRGRKCDLLLTQAEYVRARAARVRIERELLQAEEEQSTLLADMARKIEAARLRVQKLREEARAAEVREKESFGRELEDIEKAEAYERQIEAEGPAPVEFDPSLPEVTKDSSLNSVVGWSESQGTHWGPWLAEFDGVSAEGLGSLLSS